jgi:hypothetical protein
MTTIQMKKMMKIKTKIMEAVGALEAAAVVEEEDVDIQEEVITIRNQRISRSKEHIIRVDLN